MTELSKLQQAVAYQALYAALAPVVKANGDGLRGEVDRELRGIWESTGAKTYKVSVDGVTLGTYSINENKAVPEQWADVLDLVDGDAFSEWVNTEDGHDMLRLFAFERQEEFAKWCLDQGVMPDGVARREVKVPAKPSSYKGSAIRVDKGFQEQVTRRMNEGLAALVAPAGALLGSADA